MDRRRLTWLKRVLVPTFLIALFIASATIAWASESAAQATVTVEMRDNVFAPQNVTVNVGDTVTWTNQDGVPHTATALDGTFNSGNLDRGQSFSFAFEQPGTHDYVCLYHPNMRGTVVVR